MSSDWVSLWTGNDSTWLHLLITSGGRNRLSLPPDVDDDSHRPHVQRAVVAFVSQDLWGEIRRRADHGTPERLLADDPSESKVAQFDLWAEFMLRRVHADRGSDNIQSEEREHDAIQGGHRWRGVKLTPRWPCSSGGRKSVMELKVHTHSGERGDGDAASCPCVTFSP